MKRYPCVGISCIFVRDGKILLGKRKGEGKYIGQYGAPGGHLEWGEGFEEAVKRECVEETGLRVLNTHSIGVINVVSPEEDFHHVSIFMFVDEFNGCLVNMEPDKCEGWEWFSLDDLPEPSLTHIHNLRLDFPSVIHMQSKLVRKETNV